MKKIKEFLKRPAAALLLLAVVLTMSVGTLWAKYAMDVKVTDSLSLSVEVKKEYTIDKETMWTVLKSLSTTPTTLKFVKGSEVPGELTSLGNVAATGSGEIGVYMDGTTVYIAPADSEDTTSVMYAPEDSSDLLNAKDKTKLSKLTSIDCSNLDTSRVTNMAQMFYKNGNLTALDLSGFDTSKVTKMGGMFYECWGLTTLNLGSFNTSKVTSMVSMFYGDSKLTSVNLSSFDTSKVTSMASMFYGCLKLTTLDLSSFDTSSVTVMNNMFHFCSELTSLDLSGFNTSRVTNMRNMFYSCNALTTVTLGGSFDFVGTDGYLPTPSATYITNADGKWYDTTTGTGYDSSELATFHNSLDQTRTYTAVFGWLAGHIRLKINVYSVDDAGNATLTSGVPVIVRRILPDSWTTLAGWNNLVTSFSGTSDENGVVYIDRTYTWSETDGKKTVWLGTDQTNMDNIVFFHENNTMRFDIIVDTSSGYNLNPVDGKIRNCVTYYNGGPWKLTTAEGYQYDDFEFHGGLPAGDNSGSNNGGAYIEYNLYVKQMDQQTNSLNSSSAKTVTLDLSSLENIDAAPASETAGTED